MSTGAPPTLAEQRRLVREELASQRQRLARQLDAPASGGDDGLYPRSATMRWLIREPELVMTLVARIAGRRVARAVPPVLIFLRFLRAAL